MNEQQRLVRECCAAALFAVLLFFPIIIQADSDISHLRIEALENEASALLKEELTQEIILSNLQVLLDHIRLRQKDHYGLYPPLPEDLGISVDTRTIESSVIAKIITETICKLRDDVLRDQALSTLNPIIFPAIAGKIDSIPVYQGLELYFLSEFAEGGVYRKESKRIDGIIQAFTEAHHHENIDVREVAETSLVILAYTLTHEKERCERVIKAYADGDERKANNFRFQIYQASSYAPPLISPDEYDALKSKSTQELLDIFLIKNKMTDFRIAALLEERLEIDCPESNAIKEKLLNEMFDVFCQVTTLPEAILEEGASDQEKTELDAVFKAFDKVIYTTPVGNRIQRVPVNIMGILRRLVILQGTITQPIKQEWEQKRWEAIKDRSPQEKDEILDSWKPLSFRAYGTDKVVQILMKIFNRPLVSENDIHENEVENIRTALRVICEIIEQDIEYREILCNFIGEFTANLLEQYPQWKNERWFIENKKPLRLPTESSKPLLYYELREAIKFTCGRS